jgi:hypothetical protein
MNISSLGDSVNCMDTFLFPTVGQLTAFGTVRGKIVVRKDWEILPNTFDSKDPIVDLKFTRDGAYLLAANQGGILYLFVKDVFGYFNAPPKQYYIVEKDSFRERVSGVHSCGER